ncbi:MAG: oligosaccharide flippase family protein [Planctomycetes bacterium]|nr:oligosaccharide flippase family protein [Planctomycetota bacterium]
MDFAALKRRLIAGAGVTFLGNCVAAFLGLLLMLVLGRMLGVAEFGLLMAAISVASLTQGVLDVRLGEAVTKFSTDFIAHDKPGKALGLICFSYGVDFCIGLLAFCVLHFPAAFIAGAILRKPQLEPLIRVVAFVPLARFPIATSVAVLRTFNRFSTITAAVTCASVFRLSFPVLLCVTYSGDIERIVPGFPIAATCSALTFTMLAVLAIRRNFSGVKSESIRGELRTIVPFTLQTLVGVIFKNLARGDMAVTIVTRYGREEEIAYLKLGLQLSGMLTIVPSAVGFAAFSSFAELWAKREKKMLLHVIRRLVGLLTVLLVTAGILLLIVAPIFIKIWKSEYLRAMPVLYFLVAAAVVDGVCCWIRPAALAIGKPWISTLVNFVRMVVLLGLGIVLVKWIGHVGIGIATLALSVSSISLGAFLVIRSILCEQPTHGVTDTIKITEKIG